MSAYEVDIEEAWALLGAPLGLDKIPSHRGIATLARLCLSRGGPKPLREITRTLRALADLTSMQPVEAYHKRVAEVIEQLIRLQDAVTIYIGEQKQLMGAPPRWCALTDEVAVLLGAYDAADMRLLPLPDNMNPSAQVVCHVDPGDPKTLQKLNKLGFQRVDVGALAPQLPQPFDQPTTPSLKGLWARAEARLRAEGAPLSTTANARLSCLESSFYGSYKELSGSWSESSFREGIWCGVYAGYHESHWNPILARVESGEISACVGIEHDELCWLQIARAVTHEKAWYKHSASDHEGYDRVDLLTPPPEEIERTLSLMGPRANSWTWYVPSGAGSLWDPNRPYTSQARSQARPQ